MFITDQRLELGFHILYKVKNICGWVESTLILRPKVMVIKRKAKITEMDFMDSTERRINKVFSRSHK
jgi:hypothetical protein